MTLLPAPITAEATGAAAVAEDAITNPDEATIPEYNINLIAAVHHNACDVGSVGVNELND